MSCSIEMLPCDRCGREVERYEIRIVRSEEGEREWICKECAGEGQRHETRPQPDCS